MQGDDTTVTVEKWEIVQGEVLTALRLKPGPAFPKEVFDMVAVYRDLVYTLKLRGAVWEVEGHGLTLNDLFNREKLQPLTYGFVNFSNDAATPAARLREVIPLLQARALGTAAIVPHIPERPLPSNQLRLLIAAPAPPGFHMQGKGFAHENGVVLYVQDVFQP